MTTNDPVDPFFLSDQEQWEHQWEQEDGATTDRDFYSLLNVSTDATASEIRESYYKLSRTFHPDKHVGRANGEIASQRFLRIQRAYEVLTDPGLRTVYDSLGESGLDSKWDVGTRLKTPEQIRDEFKRQIRDKMDIELEGLVRGKGNIAVSIDGRSLFQQREVAGALPFAVGYARNKQISLSSFATRHSFTIPIQVGIQSDQNDKDGNSGRTSLTLASTCSVRGIQGSRANLITTIHHMVSSKLALDLSGSLFSPGRFLSTKWQYTVNPSFIASVETQSTTPGLPPITTVSCSRRLSPNTSGTIMFKTGMWTLGPWGRGDSLRRNSNLTLQCTRSNSEKIRPSVWNVQMTAGLANSALAVEYTYPMNKTRSERAVTAKNTLILATNGVEVRFGVERKVTDLSKFEFGLGLGLQGSASLRFGWSRLGQRISIPIMISDEWNEYAIIFGVVLPSVLVTAAEFGVLRPLETRVRKRQEDRITCAYYQIKRGEKDPV